jgi:peptidoglycan/LPS O-acetylase OafA/YrhL
MSSASLVVAMSLGSAAVALWVFVRFPRLAPARAGLKMAHLVAALAVAQFVAPPAMSFVIHGSDAVAPSLLALFLIFVPSQLWAYLSGIWVLALLRNALVLR